MSDKASYDVIRKAAVKGVAWTTIESVARQVIQVVTNLLLARLLAPSEFGVLGMALIFQGVAQLLADFGIGAALVQQKTLEQDTLSSSFWLNLAVAAGLTAILYALAPLIGRFYESSEVTPLIQALSFSLLVGGLRTLPRALLYRELGFNTLSRIGIASSFAGAAVALAMAFLGFGPWSLLAQPLIGNITELALLWVATPWRPTWAMHWPSVRPIVQFSYGVLGTNLLNYGVRNTDNLLIGKFLGSGPLGYYALAYQIMLYPLGQVSNVIVKVLYPTLARLQDTPAQLRDAFLTGVSTIALLTFPMMCGLLLVSRDFIIVVFGEKWLPMELVLKVFCGIGLLQSIATTVGTLYMCTGQTRLMMRVTLYAAPPVIASFVLGLRWGIEGVAICYGVVTFILFFVLLRIALGLVDMRLGDVFRAVRGAAIASLFLSAATALAIQQLADAGPEIRLAVAVLTGALTYAVASWVFNREQLDKLIAYRRQSQTGQTP